MALHFTAKPKPNADKGLPWARIESQREIDKVGLGGQLFVISQFLRRVFVVARAGRASIDGNQSPVGSPSHTITSFSEHAMSHVPVAGAARM
jgi:hypothetical protein